MKNSDRFSFANVASKAGRSFAALAIAMSAFVTVAAAQDLTVIEGSVYSFSVEYHDGNSFVWNMHDASFGQLGDEAYDFLTGDTETNVTVKFNDMDRVSGELVYLAVTESRPTGCSTVRAISIQVEPNNMYLEFAMAEVQECYTGEDYNAALRVGLNFKDKDANVPIPAERFPLKLSYTVKDITNDGELKEVGPVVIEYNENNEYSLLITDAIGNPETLGSATQTTTYELTITEVTDKYQAEIKQNEGDARLQIRIINHLPQGGKMDMVMAYIQIP